VEAEYSEQARNAEYQGVVALYVLVDGSGSAVSVHVLQNLGLGLDERAVEAVRHWRFQPGISDGQPTLGELAVEVGFRLPGHAPWQVSRAVHGLAAPPKRSGRRLARFTRPVLTRYTRPDDAPCAGRSGAFAVAFVIDRQGNTAQVHLSRGESGPLAEAAVRAVGAWRYQPALLNGKPVLASGDVELNCEVTAHFDPPSKDEPPVPVFRAGRGVSKPVTIHQVDPNYTETARRAGRRGATLLQAEVYPDGYAHNITIVQFKGSTSTRWRSRRSVSGSSSPVKRMVGLL